MITDNGACYRSAAFGRRTKHRRTKPFKPQDNGKAECYRRIMADKVLYARAYEARRNTQKPSQPGKHPLQLL
ncbi:hypothetical protein [Halostreptopolyspora alba]|uniref:hypothetical protein n=1 Tax=Halostreptopolyspora alba TaxID=2487137 RepID=UPI0026CAFCCB